MKWAERGRNSIRAGALQVHDALPDRLDRSLRAVGNAEANRCTWRTERDDWQRG
jgi:hypothetical protein